MQTASPRKRCRSDHVIATVLAPDRWTWDITVGFLLAWIGILIYLGAIGSPRTPTLHWRQKPYGFSTALVMNVMTRDAFRFIRRFIHFADNSRMPKKGAANYDPLYKINPVLRAVQIQFQKGWSAGPRVTIDESMIKYKGRAIVFVQYMPKKPIKHGIKVFALCDSETGYMLSFEIYTGSDGTDYGSAKNVIDRLLRKAGVHSAVGRTLYTDNWYTSIPVARHLFEQYGWLYCGTIKLTDKKERAADDLPFHKLSAGALANVPRGWSRRATRPYKTSKGYEYQVQCTVWKDRKQVGFLHTTEIRGNDGATARRAMKGKKRRVVINCPPAQKDYAANFNGVDLNDRDCGDYSTSIRSNRWYLRIFFWSLDRVVFSCYIVASSLAKAGIKPAWKKYLSSDGGRYDFQIDLALAVMEAGIRYDWGDVTDESKKPKWMRSQRCVPCECGKCFFCKTGRTTGIAPKSQTGTRVRPTVGGNCRWYQERLLNHEGAPIKNGRVCSLCLSKTRRLLGKNATAKEVKSSCAKTLVGCRNCNKAVCTQCWPEFEHK